MAHLSNKRRPGAKAPPTAEYIAEGGEEERDTNKVDEDEDEDVDDDDDPGTSWFTEHDAPRKVLRFLTSREFPLAPCNTVPATQRGAKKPSAMQPSAREAQPSILDLGTGNGSMLALLRKKGGFRGPMVGVDYSPRSVELARELQRLKLHSAYESDDDSDTESASRASVERAEKANEENEHDEEDDVVVAGDAGAGAVEAIPVPETHTEIRFEVWDILNSTDALTREEIGEGKNALDWFPYDKGGFDIVLDKGTFDAVSLSDEIVEEEGKGTSRVVQRRVCERYPGVVNRLVRKGGFVVVTSCNWTEEELVRWFTGGLDKEEQGQDGLYVWGRVEYPRFRFGGQEGQGVCTVCFRRRGGD